MESPLGPMLVVVLTSGFIPAVLGNLVPVAPFGISEGDYAVASTIWLLFVIVAVLAYVTMGQSHSLDAFRSPFAGWYPGIEERLLTLWVIAMFIAAVVIAGLLGDAGGFGAYVDSLNERAEIFNGKLYLKALLTAPAVIALFILAVHLRATSIARSRALVWTVIFTSGAILLIMGSRQQPVVFLAVAVIYHYTVKPLAFRHVAAGILTVMLFGIALSTATRGPEGDQKVITAPTDTWAKLETAGPISDFGQLASIAMIAGDDTDNRPEMGSTYVGPHHRNSIGRRAVETAGRWRGRIRSLPAHAVCAGDRASRPPFRARAT